MNSVAAQTTPDSVKLTPLSIHTWDVCRGFHSPLYQGKMTTPLGHRVCVISPSHAWNSERSVAQPCQGSISALSTIAQGGLLSRILPPSCWNWCDSSQGNIWQGVVVSSEQYLARSCCHIIRAKEEGSKKCHFVLSCGIESRSGRALYVTQRCDVTTAITCTEMRLPSRSP